MQMKKNKKTLKTDSGNAIEVSTEFDNIESIQNDMPMLLKQVNQLSEQVSDKKSDTNVSSNDSMREQWNRSCSLKK